LGDVNAVMEPLAVHKKPCDTEQIQHGKKNMAVGAV